MAAESMQDIRRRIKSVTGTEHITRAMKLVSSSKLRKARKIFDASQEYVHFVTATIQQIFNNADHVPPEYLEGSREVKNTCYIVVTSSRGLCGGFNSNVLKQAHQLIKAEPDYPKIVAVGSKGLEYFQQNGYPILEEYMDPPEDISFLESHEISRPIIERYDSGEFDRVVLVSTKLINALEQEVKAVTLLPFSIEHDPDVPKLVKQVEYEPSEAAVFNYLVPKYVEIMIYGAIVESATCEHAARRMAMENATKSADDMLAALSLSYNRARQEAITNELSEIVGGSEALK